MSAVPCDTSTPPEIHRIDEPVRLGAAEVVGRPVRKPVDGGADLRLADGHLEAAHGDVARPVVEAVGVPFLNGYAGQVIHHRRHARDIRLLQQHRFGDDVAREDPGLIGDDAHRFEQPRDLQRDRDRCGGVRPDGYRGFRGLETRQNSRDDIVARRKARRPYRRRPHRSRALAARRSRPPSPPHRAAGCRLRRRRRRRSSQLSGLSSLLRPTTTTARQRWRAGHSYRRPMLWLSCERSPLRAFYEPDDRRRPAVFESSQRHAGLPARPQTPRRPPRAVETGSFRGGATAVLIVPDTPVRPSRGRVPRHR